MNLEIAFLFWPVCNVATCDGWAYGTYSHLQQAPLKSLIEGGRLRRERRKRGILSDDKAKAAFRHYEAQGIALQTGRILMETFQLDEEQFMDPGALVSQKQARTAFKKFLKLKYGDDDAAVGYIRAFGEFDHLELEGDKFTDARIPGLIQQFCKECVRSKQDPFAVSLSSFWAIRDDIEGFLKLAKAIWQKDCDIAKDQCRRRRPNSDFCGETDWLALAQEILCVDLSALVNAQQQNPRLILTRRQGAIVALTMAKTVRSALYLTLFDMIVSKTNYKNCRNCNQFFLVTAKRKEYCDPTCRNTAKVKKYRNKKR